MSVVSAFLLPGPIPEHEARWAWEWMASWGLMSGRFDAATQINRKVEEEAHKLATAGFLRQAPSS